MRARYTRLVEAGPAICARCRRPIVPGEPWDLGHVDGDGSRYAGPEHRRCNRHAGAKQGAAIVAGHPRVQGEQVIDTLGPFEIVWKANVSRGGRRWQRPMNELDASD
jgi:hypothetical protein